MRTNRYMNSLVALIVTALLILASCQKEEEALLTTISLDENVISLVLGTSQTLIPRIEPPASTSAIVWSSNNPEVAIVNEEGLVQAVGLGKTVINAKIGNSTSFCDVIVTDQVVPVRGITLDKISLGMRVGDVEQLVANINPYEATNQRKRWSSNNDEVVSVHEITGTLTAHAYGQAVITVTTLDGEYTATCLVTVLPIIELFTPGEGNIVLDPAGIGKNISFTWNEIDGLELYVLKISTSDRFAQGDVLYTKSTAENNLNISEYELNELIHDIPDDVASLYWTIEPGTSGFKVLPAIGRLNLIPDRREFLTLVEASASGMQLQKMQDTYHYAITTNGQATVNTVGMPSRVHTDSTVVSLKYKSNRDLQSAAVHFVSAEGTVRGTIQKDITQASQWTTMRFLQSDLPSEWGNAGDYLRFDFGNASGYEIEVNAISLSALTIAEQKEAYVPEIIRIRSFNHSIVEAHEDNYYRFESNGNDPFGSTFPLERKLPSGAVIFSFEYKSNIPMEYFLQVYLGPSLSESRSIKTGVLPANASGEWLEYTVDMSELRATYPEWGMPGDNLRIDFGNFAGLRMEVQNIHFKFND